MLRLLLSRSLYNKHSSLIDRAALKETHRQLAFVYSTVDHLHAAVSDRDLSVDEVETMFWAEYPDAAHDLYDGIFKDLRAVDVSEEVGGVVLQQMALKNASIRLADASYELSQGRGSLEEVQRLTAALSENTDIHEEQFVSVSTNLEQLVSSVVSKPGLRWRLNCLNVSLGSLRKGDFGFIFARPESGKTTFLASEVSGMVDQAESPILWFNYEEQGEKVMLRIAQAYFGITLTELLGNIKHYRKLFDEKVGKKLVLVDGATTSNSSIERTIHSVQPSLIVLDQVDKVKGFKADRDDLVQGAIYQWARELAKEYAPVVGASQADGTAEGQKWLTMAHVANAKTAKQAEADWILGMGKTHEETSEYIRYFNISKNKLMGDKDSIPHLRHARFETLIQPDVARFKDIVEYS